MTKIEESRDCGNSPKNSFVQTVAIALETGEALPEAFSDAVVWHGAGTEPLKPLEGIEAVQAHLDSLMAPVAVVIEHAISHGRTGAASGEVTLADGRTRRFAHVLEFTSAKANRVAVIKSYG